MSTLFVEVSKIDQILPHTNADALELAVIKGFQCVVKKGQFQPGDKVVYFPPDTMMTKELATRLGVLSYLSIRNTTNPAGQTLEAAKTKVIKLRGEPSMGLLVTPDDLSWEIGTNVAEHYGVWKYEPPMDEISADQGHEHPLFGKYTDIENLRYFPDMLEGMEVVATEKIHGSNVRVGIVFTDVGDPTFSVHSLMAGSRRLRRKVPVKPCAPVPFPFIQPEILVDFNFDPTIEGYEVDYDAMVQNRFWYPHTLQPVRDLLSHLMLNLDEMDRKSVILYGEIYGNGIQKGFNYGFASNFGFRAFDLSIDGRYVDYTVFEELCNRFGVETAPLVYRGVYDLEKLRELTNGPSTLPGATHIREGIVVRPVSEGWDRRVGRMILKFVGDDYLDKKESGKISDFTDQ